MNPEAGEHLSQTALILRELQRNAGRWVAMPALAEVSGAYAVHSRIADLRADGYQIDTRIEGTRPRRSYYRLVVRMEQPELLTA